MVNPALPDRLQAWREPQGVVFAATELYEFVSIPQRGPDGLLATVVAVRTRNPNDRIVTFDDLFLEGDLHQTWDREFGMQTADEDSIVPNGLFAAEWSSYDSHLRIRNDMIRYGYGGWYFTEENDGSDPLAVADSLPREDGLPFRPKMGLGMLGLGNPTSVFFLMSDYQEGYFELAYIVTPAVMPDSGERGEVFVTVGVSGSDENNQPLPDIGAIGLDTPVRIPFFAEPCDFNADGRCDLLDVDQLLARLGTADPNLNLDPFDELVTVADLNVWLNDAGTEKIGTAYVLGDTNLDGDVDARDLNALGLRWQQTGSIGWSGGDFNSDQRVNAHDLNVLALNWHHSAHATVAVSVPESAGLSLCLVAFVAVLVTRRCRPWGAV